MDGAARRRLKWVRMYAENADAGLTCRRCGISRPTLRLWARRYSAQGKAGLNSRSRRPRNSPRQRVFQAEREQILSLRRDRNLGARRIQIELRLMHRVELSITRIQRVLSDERVPPLRRPRRAHAPRRYARPTPGERVQLDTMKVAAAVYQYTAVDDCSRLRA
jgi:transposase